MLKLENMSSELSDESELKEHDVKHIKKIKQAAGAKGPAKLASAQPDGRTGPGCVPVMPSEPIGPCLPGN